MCCSASCGRRSHMKSCTVNGGACCAPAGLDGGSGGVSAFVSATKKSSCVAERLKATHRCGLVPSISTTLTPSCRPGLSSPAASSPPCACHCHRNVRLPAVTATSSPVEWKAMQLTTKSKCCLRMHCRVWRSQMRTLWSSEPEARYRRCFGWNLTVHGVRSCPRSVQSSRHDEQLNTFTVWSPCVLAKSSPSAEKARAIVDFASACSWQ
mmetsp:Transcript_18108/g.45405  ORF Transcript_18108/g.45405 Transcript_18108/m.45405 type:complete len:209 (-) Transcript_18108:213-839(-)